MPPCAFPGTNPGGTCQLPKFQRWNRCRRRDASTKQRASASDTYLARASAPAATQPSEITMSENYIVHPQPVAPDQSGVLVDLPRERAGWQWMSFSTRRLEPGDKY